MKHKKILIVGGCFDILHKGHIDFLKKARKLCDYLIVLLEPDEKVRLMKGTGRPINNEKLRITNLESTGLADKIVLLPILKTSEDYEKEIKYLILNFKFQTSNLCFGITKDDKNVKKNENIEKLSKKMGIEVIEVNKLLLAHSTTKILTNTN